MSFLLNLIPAPYRMLALGGLVLALLALWGGDRYFHGARQYAAGKAEVKKDWDAAVSRAREAALIQADLNAKETQRRMTAQKEIEDAHQAETARLRAAAARAADAAGRMRGELATFRAAVSRAAGNPEPVAGVPSAAGALDLLAQLLSGSGDTIVELAAFADASRAAGLACERAYESLITPRAPKGELQATPLPRPSGVSFRRAFRPRAGRSGAPFLRSCSLRGASALQ